MIDPYPHHIGATADDRLDNAAGLHVGGSADGRHDRKMHLLLLLPNASIWLSLRSVLYQSINAIFNAIGVNFGIIHGIIHIFRLSLQFTELSGRCSVFERPLLTMGLFY